MASASGKGNDGGVSMEELKALEYELLRNRKIEENQRRMAVVRQKGAAFQEIIEASKPPKKKRKKATSDTPVIMNGGPTLRSSVRKDCDRVDPAQQPSNEITPELTDDGGKKKGGRKITQKANIYARLNQPKIHIPLNHLGQPIGAKATEFANFIGTLVRKHIPRAELDWRDVDEEKKLLVWKTLQAFYEVDTTAFGFVINTSHTKWEEWKADLKKTKFDATLTDEELMKRRDERITETDWQSLIDYWRSPVFESRSAIAKKNRANAVPHTAGSKSHARVTQEMADELGHMPRRDEVYIRTHTRKQGDYVPQAATTIKNLIDKAEKHPELKEKSIEDGDLFAQVCGMKEPRGCVRVLGLGVTPQDLHTPGTRGKVSTRVLVEMEGRRQAENRMNMMAEQMQQMQEQINQMKELILGTHGGHNLEVPSSHQDKCQELKPTKITMVKKMMVTKKMMKGPTLVEELLQLLLQNNPQPTKMKALFVWMCYSLRGLVLKLRLLRQQLSQLILTLAWAGSPLDQILMRLLSMSRSKKTLYCLINMMVYVVSLMLSKGRSHGHPVR